MTAAGRASSPPNTCRAPAPDDSSLVGIWGAEESYGPLVRGELTVLQRAGKWEAHIAGFEISPRTAGDSIWVVMPAGQGEFRGRVLPDSQAIAGFWIQPAGVVGSVSYASPLRLVQTAGARRTRVWRGSVVPLEDRFSLYLVVRRRPDGSVIGSFHNPEANSRGGAAAFAIDRKGTTVRFVDTTSDRSRAAPVILASYDSAQHQLVVPWADLGRPIVLSRRSCEDAVGLYPRTPADPNYRYRAPLPGNGWAAVRAESAGLNEERLAELVRYIAGGDPEVDTTPLIHSVLVARHGRLVLEEYFFGYDEGRPHDLRSASKTFASVLVGAAIMHGASIRPSTPVYPLFHNEAPFANPDPRKQQITLGQLMTHSTGLACDDNGDALPGNEDVMQSQQAQPDWYKFTLDLPMIHDPGERYGYCSATMNLVGGVLAAAEQRWLPAMFDEWVAGPLEFQRYYVNLMPTGQAYFGGGMQLVPRDLLKLGTTYLDGGVWNGRRIVTKAWIEQSTAKQIGPPQATSPDGYAWHLHTLTSGGHEYREYEANGNGGQFLIVLPDLDLAVVLTGADYGRYRIWRQWRDALVPDYVIAAVADPR
jgi:CubicO group peptidase (beta-lactamase class C family)